MLKQRKVRRMATRKRKAPPSQVEKEAAETVAVEAKYVDRIDRIELIEGKSCLVVLVDGSSFQYHDYDEISEVFAQMDANESA